MPVYCRFLMMFLFLGLSACSGIDDIDRTQPGKLQKSALEGEWYYRQTVVDVPFTVGMTFIGEQSSLERIRWEISEGHLTAYRSYERVEDSEIPSLLPNAPYQGAPIASFPILSHFDVQRIYNEATGEQTNVLVENTSDRPWYDRAYIRVDWSNNLLANFEFMAGGESGLGITAQPASYAVTNPHSLDAPVFGVLGKTGDWVDYRDPMVWGALDSVDYFDVTTKLQISPETFLVEYDDGTSEPWPACWFYEYGPWDCASQTIKVRASFLRVQPSDYEPLYYPDNYVARDADGHPIRTTYDPDVGYRRCRTDEIDNCSTVRIPMFDWFGFFRREREAYDRDYGITESGKQYYADRFNIWQRSTRDDGSKLPYEERTIRPIVYHLSENFPAELIESATEVGTWWNESFVETVRGLTGALPEDAVFQVAPNSFSSDEDGIRDFGQRNGDLRYSHLYWVDNPQFDSLLGYGPSAADPLTGEVIAADAYVYGAAIDTYVSYAADVIALTEGSLNPATFIEGENVSAALENLREPSPPSRAERIEDVQNMMNGGLLDRLASIQSRASSDYETTAQWRASRLALADNHPQSARLWNNELRQTLEKRFGRALKPSELGAGKLARAYERHRRALGAKGVDLNFFEDASVLHLVDEFSGLERSERMTALRAYLFKAVAAHEIGHTLGLRHNFAGSADALNYHDHYWDIRDTDAEALDLPTTDEMREGLREYAYSSIMDYGSRFNSDVRGLGKYDIAAIKFGYGQLVEAFVTPPDWSEHDVLEYYNLDDAIERMIHYTDLPALFSSDGRSDGRTNMASRRDIPMHDVIAWMTLDPNADDLTDTLVPYKFCSDEYAGARWDCDLFDEGADPYEIVHYAARNYRESYLFRSFKRHQRYVDPFEVYYDVYSRTLQPMATQYHLWLYDQWDMAYEWTWLHGEGTTATETSDWNLDKHGGLARSAAAMSSINFMSELIATPEPGSYYLDPSTNILTWWTYDEDILCESDEDSSFDACSDLYIPLGAGKYAYSEFDSASGYHWFEKVRVVGAFWDKLAALETLSDPTTYFLGVDDVADATAYNLGFNVAFPHAVETIFGSIISDDYSRFAPRIDPTGEFMTPSILDSAENALNDKLPQPAPGTLIDPATNFTVSLYAMYYGMALLNANFDQSFNDNARIWLEGHGESVTPANGVEVTSFVNPFNGLTYRAAQAPDPLDYSLGYQMLSKANTLRSTIEDHNPSCFFEDSPECQAVSNERFQLQGLIENIEVLRGYYDVFGYAWF